MKNALTKMIIGKSGTGKSWIGGKDIEDIMDERGMFPVVLDKKDDHVGLGNELNYRTVVVDSNSAQAGVDFWMEYIRGLIDNTDYQGLRISLNRNDADVTDHLVELGDDVARAIYLLGLDNYDIYAVYEELKNWTPDDENPKDFSNVNTLITEGRSIGVGFLGITQFPQQVHYKIYKGCNIYMLFYLGEDKQDYKKVISDRNTISEMMSWNASDRNYLLIDQNIGKKERKNSSDMSRKTTHTG